MPFDFAAFTERIRQDRASGNQWIYRGHSSMDWTLDSSYVRYCRKKHKVFVMSHFFEMLNKFVDAASDFICDDLSKLGICQKIALAQHHGLPTPFLDWSESPYVAAFFALCERQTWPSTNPFTIWALRVEPPFDDGASLVADALMDENYPYRVVRPKVYQSRRLSRQFGLFTFFGKDQNMEEHLRSEGNFLKRYDIDGDRWSALLVELHMMGISGCNLYDDLNGVVIDTLVREGRIIAD